MSVNSPEEDLEVKVELRRSKGLTRNTRLSWSRNSSFLNSSIDEGLNKRKDSFDSKRLSLSRMDSIADDELKSNSFWENRRSGDFTFRQNSNSSEGGNDTRMRSSIIVTTAESTEQLAPERKTSTFRRFLGFKKSKEDETKIKTNEVYVDICHSGVLIEPGKDRTEWRVTLDKDFLRWISDKGRNSVGVLNITSVTASNSFDAACPYGFEVTYISADKTDHVQVFATRTEEERAVWMQMILQVAVPEPFPNSLSRDFARAGLGNVKEGTAGAWVSTWLLLRERELFYCVQPGNLLALDLRKAKGVVTQSSGASLEVHVDVQERSLWLRSPGEGDTRRWGHCLHAAALNNGATLEQQQLTREDVPVIVDKCIEFVTHQGDLCAGLYGHCASSAAVSSLLSEFRLRDAWRLGLNSRSGLDVAAALARFFAELEQPLFHDTLAKQLVSVAYSKCHDGVKVDRYRSLLRELPRVHHVTSRRLLGHLHFLQRSNNSRVDLAAVWSTCLMRQTEDLNEAGMTSILYGLISLYPRVYDVTDEEISREMRMLQAVQQIHEATHDVTDSKYVSDLLIWVYLDSYNSGETVQIAVGPQTTSRDICAVFNGVSDIMLQEFVLGGSLSRPLHPLEKVMEVVLRWGDWDETDRRDNQLVLAPCIFYAEIKAMGKPRARTVGELKFADAGSRHFATYEFELSQTALSFARDKKSPKLGEWRINDIVWYLGHEPKREPLSKWSITFISKGNRPNRTRDQPYFGCALGGSSKKELLHWCAGLLLAQFPGML